MPSSDPRPELVSNSSTGIVQNSELRRPRRCPSHFSVLPSLLGLPNSMTSDEEVQRDDDEEHAIDTDNQGCPNECRQVTADETSEWHSTSEGQHVNAHHASAHFVRGNQLNE